VLIDINSRAVDIKVVIRYNAINNRLSSLIYEVGCDV
jgi:hypothetical protein